MAEETVKTIVDVQIDKAHSDDLLAKLDRSKKAIIGLKQEQKDLNDNFKKGNITLDEYAKQSVRVEQLTKQQTNSYNKLSHELQGTKSLTDTLNKGFESQAGIIDKAIPGLGSFASGIASMTKEAIAFIATPLGATLAAIALLATPIISFFRDTQRGQELASIATADWNARLDVLKDRLTDVGEAMVNAFSNEKPNSGLSKVLKGILYSNPLFLVLKGNLEALKKIFPDVTKEMDDEAKIARDAAAAQIELTKAQDDFILRHSQNQKIIKENQQLAADQNKSYRDRIDALKLAGKTEEDDLNKRLDLQKKVLAQSLGLASVTDEQIQKFQEEGIALDQVGKNKSIEEQRKKAIEALAAINDLQSESATVQRTIIAQQSALEKKYANERKAAAQKEVDDDIAKYDRERQVQADALAARKQFEDEFYGDRQKQADEAHKNLVASIKRTDQQIKKEDEKANKDRIKDAKAALEEKQAITNAEISLYEGFGQAIQDFAGKNKEATLFGLIIQKAAAIASIISNLGSANLKAVNGSWVTVGQPWVTLNTIAAGLNIAAIVKQTAQSVAEINATPPGFARGGKILSGQPIRRSNGDDVLITAKRDEVILNKRQQWALGGDEVFRRAGVPGFAEGGRVLGGNIQTSIASEQYFQDQAFRQLAQALQNLPAPIVTVEDINAGQQARAQVVNRATIFKR